MDSGGEGQDEGRKGKGLFMPLRLAVTGEPSGPEMADLMPLLQKVRARGLRSVKQCFGKAADLKESAAFCCEQFSPPCHLPRPAQKGP